RGPPRSPCAGNVLASAKIKITRLTGRRNRLPHHKDSCLSRARWGRPSACQALFLRTSRLLLNRTVPRAEPLPELIEQRLPFRGKRNGMSAHSYAPIAERRANGDQGCESRRPGEKFDGSLLQAIESDPSRRGAGLVKTGPQLRKSTSLGAEIHPAA